MSPQKIKVLVVDDSAMVRQTLQAIFEETDDIEVVATAADPYVAAQRMREGAPDVITLDIEMPRMDGITFLRKLMNQHPIPVVVCSSLAESDSTMTLQALDAGAVEIITKPKIGTRQFLEESSVQITDAVRAAAQAKLKKLHTKAMSVQPKLTADAMLPQATRAMDVTTDKVIVIGASTGGTEAVRVVLEGLPQDSPGIVVVQHMPENFTRSFADRLNQTCAISVKEASNGDSVLRGHALIAPGNLHTMLKRSGARYHVDVREGPLVSRHRPSVDVLFRSAARYAGKNAIAVILTGMGDDGARGMKELHDIGAVTIGQDEASCIVYGMPKVAYEMGAVEVQKPLTNIAGEIVRQVARVAV